MIMIKDGFIKWLLLIIAVLLLLNLFTGRINSSIVQKVAAASAQKLVFRGNGIGIACSSDGRYVYAAGSGSILRSTDYGSAGSWETVITE